MDTYSDKDKEFEVQLTSPSMISLPKEQTASQHNVTVSQLDILDGLKELLISHDFTAYSIRTDISHCYSYGAGCYVMSLLLKSIANVPNLIIGYD
jgi:hypothetical protein